MAALPRAAAGDPALDGYIGEAIANNRELRARGHEIDLRHEAIREARGNYLPTVTADLRYTRLFGGLDLGDAINPAYAALNQVIGEPRFPTDLRLQLPLTIDAKLRIAQPVYMPVLAPATRLAELAEHAERLGRRITRREIVAAVGATYYGHARAAQLATLLRQTRPLLEENLAVSTALVGARKATDDVVLRARAELAQHDQRLRAVEQAQRAARRALNVLTAAPVDREISAPAELSVPSVPGSPAPLIARARKARGELALLDVARDATQQQRALARTAYLPTLVVALDLGLQGPELTLDPDDTYAAVNVVASWNLFNGGRDRSRARQRDHEQRALAARRQQLSDQVEREVTTAWEAARVAADGVTAAQTRVDSTQAAYEILARRYAASDVPQLEVLVAQNALIAARTDRIVAITDLHVALLELERVIATEEQAR